MPDSSVIYLFCYSTKTWGSPCHIKPAAPCCIYCISNQWGHGAHLAIRSLLSPVACIKSFFNRDMGLTLPYRACCRLSPCQQPKTWWAINRAEVKAVKVDPIQSVWARHHRPWPPAWGCRVMRMMPVSHRCTLGSSTAATCMDAEPSQQ